MDSLYTAEGVINKHMLWEQHASLVRREALRMRVRLPSSVELDDLIQAGGLGLLSAVEVFDPQMGVPFAGFAVQRIRFAMLDELRNRDWAPRSIRSNARKITQTLAHLEKKLGRNATESEIAGQLEISVEEYQKMLLDTNGCQLFSYEESHEEMGDAIEALTEQHERQNPFHYVMADELREQIMAALETLPEREKLVFILYYQEDLNLREIAEVLEVGESRVSQLHSEAIKRLRSRLVQRQPSGFDATDIETIANLKSVAVS